LAPPANRKPCILFRASEARKEGRFGEQESQSGTVRADPAGVRAWGRNDPGGGPETGDTPARGTEGDGQRDAGGTQSSGTRAAEAGGGDPIYRRDSGSRPQGAQKAAAHGAPDLGAAAPGDARSRSGGIDASPVCARPKGS